MVFVLQRVLHVLLLQLVSVHAAMWRMMMELNTGERVLTTAIEIQPAAIVLDLAMPVVTGYEALLALKENPATAGIPVIIASAQRGSGVVNTVRDLGAINFLLKPWQEDELVPLVQQAIDSAAE